MLKTSITFDKNIEHLNSYYALFAATKFLQEKIYCYNLIRIQLYRENCVQYIKVQYSLWKLLAGFLLRPTHRKISK